MGETYRNIMAAYNKGALASRAQSVQCPYGSTKKELQAWFRAGLADAQNKTLDVDMLYRTTRETLRVSKDG